MPEFLRAQNVDVHIAEQRGLATSAAGGVAVEELTADEPLRVRRRSPPQTLRDIQIVDLKANEEAELYQATFSSPLPTIRIPLRPTDKDVLLPLQSLVNQAYENGRYGSQLDYKMMPEPALQKQHFGWITQYLSNKHEG